MPDVRASSRKPQAASLLWGLFCACSWTWCIGMYLPRILIERFGWPGFIAFAVPNVIGCAAFGYVVKTRQRSEAMVARRGAVMTSFSAVTIAYHLFFIVWLFAELIAPAAPEGSMLRPLAAALIVFLLGLVLSFLDNRDWLVLAAAVYLLSLISFGVIGIVPLKSIPWHGSDSLTDLAWMTPVIVFGFLFCPYLDLTFHRAIQNAPSRHAFSVFGVSFAVMIVLTCAIWFSGSPMLRGFALAHILAQSVFTVGAHLREVRLSPVPGDRGWRMLVMILPVASALLLYVGRMFSSAAGIGEDLYLRFLVFYGLVFPAYVLLSAQNRRRLTIGMVVIVSLPFYEMGFIHHRSWTLMIPMAVLVVLSLLGSNSPTKNPRRTGG